MLRTNSPARWAIGLSIGLLIGLLRASVVGAQYDDPGVGGDDDPPTGCLGIGAKVTIDSVAMTFSPSTVTVDPGEKVCWTWSTGGVPHNIQSDNERFRSGPPDDSFTFSRTFGESGTFGYHCQVHGSLTSGMRGTIIVRGDSEPPATPQIRLAATTYAVAEGSALNVVVERLGEPTGAAAVRYDQSPGSAKPGADFTKRAGTLNWANGDGASKSFQIPTKADPRVEGNETFAIKLSKPVGAPLGDSVATVTIQEPSNCPTNVVAPSAPTARGRSSDTIEVSWHPTHAAHSANAAAVARLERRSGDGPFEELTVSAAHGRFLDSGLSPGTVYQYRLRAEGADGSIAISPSASAATDAAVAPCNVEAGEACLLAGRFAVDLRFDGEAARPARWRGVEGSSSALVGSSGVGSSDEARDLLLRVTDGCAENGHYWVSVAAVTDFEITVRDTTTGRIWVHSGGAGVGAPVVADRDAFVCDRR